MKRNFDELTDAECERVMDTFRELVPTVLPADWVAFGEELANARWFRSRDGLRVCLAVEDVDRELWLHVSFSRRDRVPNWHDTRRVKALFVGADRKACQVLPSESEHYSLHPYCLHLFSCLARDPLPDFRDATGALLCRFARTTAHCPQTRSSATSAPARRPMIVQPAGNV